MQYSKLNILTFGLLPLASFATAIPTEHGRHNNRRQLSNETSGVTSDPALPGTTPVSLTPSNPPSASDVTNSIVNWAKDVDTVNAFLNDATLAGAGLALTFALDEPVQLGTLMTVRGLSTTGLQAAGTLAINFPSIPENLNDTIAGKQSLTTATTNINLNRCCTILPNINVLWIEAAAASGAGTPPPIEFENTCADIDCPEGASPEPAE